MQQQATVWRRSSYSGVEHNCVEVGRSNSVALVRDSKRPAHPNLRFSPGAWAAFLVRRTLSA